MAYAENPKASFVDEISIKDEPIEECSTNIYSSMCSTSSQHDTLEVYGSIKQEKNLESNSYLKECFSISASTEELGVYGSIKQEQNPDESNSYLKECFSISASTDELGVYGSIKEEQNTDESDSCLKECISIGASTDEYPEVKLEPQYCDVKLEPRPPERETSQQDPTSDCSSPTIAVPSTGLKLTKGSREQTETPFICNICNGQYFSMAALTTHTRTHENPLICTIRSRDRETSQDYPISDCSSPTIAVRSSGLELMKGSREQTEPPFICDICNGQYFSMAALSRHTTRTHGNPLVSDIKFSREHNLKLHTRTHTGEKPYWCATCDAKFSHVNSLRRHACNAHKYKEASESLRQPCKCPICSKRFTVPSSLRKHMRTQHQRDYIEKRYSCEKCEETFDWLSDLKFHACKYADEKLLCACDECGATSTNMSWLVEHLQSHSGRPFSCGVCDAKFAYSRALAGHMEIHTADALMRRFC